MARGRPFDSDASGSGSHGGRGPGHSAHGRGGSIPHPSSGTSRASSSVQRPVLPPSHPSSGTSGASSSAQRPVLPPSQPSAPSSSGPVQTPPAAQSPTVQARQILRIIKLQLHKEGYTWDAVPQEARDFYWEEFQENYTTARERIVTSQTDESEAESRIDKLSLYLEAVGGEKKRKVYGIGSQASQFYTGSAAHASTASAAPQPEHTDSHYDDDIRAQLADQQRQIAELRAHVMRLSGEQGAGTSSSDPAPATDRHVSTSQQQPLSAPDPDAADDTLVTPPGATSHPAGTPPGDPTSDATDEQTFLYYS
ncbi:hypothetical protein JCGZ_11226 [Jatropha curcas]|uniref:Uncharacterized protein n=1 Tax=Jatropha curcas TaxID=180498 RepID=A0A067KH76_JATCU|nr:hypothetical protein JCGZ_11226 [Jatropha curcas]